MRKLAVLVLVFWSSYVLADELITTKSGRAVLLKDNGTWEYVKAQESTAPDNTAEQHQNSTEARADCGMSLKEVPVQSSPTGLKSLSCGERVTVLTRGPDWVRIRNGEGKEGYVSKFFVAGGNEGTVNSPDEMESRPGAVSATSTGATGQGGASGTDGTSSSSGKTVHVRGYTRKDGTYVRPHDRSAPHRRK